MQFLLRIVYFSFYRLDNKQDFENGMKYFLWNDLSNYTFLNHAYGESYVYI